MTLGAYAIRAAACLTDITVTAICSSRTNHTRQARFQEIKIGRSHNHLNVIIICCLVGGHVYRVRRRREGRKKEEEIRTRSNEHSS